MAYRIFISSVQREFAKERKALAEYIRKDAILGKFFEVFLFEEVPAQERKAEGVYLSEVDECVGSGTGDIIESCREKGLPPPVWENEDDGFTVTLRRVTRGTPEERSLQTTQKTTPETTIEVTIETTIENLGMGTRAVYDALAASPTSNLEQIAEKTGMTKDGVFYHVKVLRKELDLRHEGPTEKGRWVFDRTGGRK